MAVFNSMKVINSLLFINNICYYLCRFIINITTSLRRKRASNIDTIILRDYDIIIHNFTEIKLKRYIFKKYSKQSQTSSSKVITKCQF